MWKVFAVSMLLLSCATDRKQTATGRTAGEFIDDATMTANANAVIVGDADARYFKIDVTTTQGDVVLQGFVNSLDTESRLVAQIGQLRGVRSVRSLLRVEAH